MTNLLKEFIEDNITLIEEEDYEGLYEQAYEWLPHEHVAELTKVLSSALNIDFETYAKENIIKHVATEIGNFIVDGHLDLTLSSFVRLYMNHINGIDWDEFQMLVEQELKDSKLVSTYDDGAGNLHIGRKTR